MRSALLCLVFASIGVLLTLALFAQTPPVVRNGSQVQNWTVPPYHRASASGGLSTMTDISQGIAFVAMNPCRVFDTRNANGPYGGPRLLANTTRNFDIDDGLCGPIPAGVEAYSMNFGAILPYGANSFVTIWPTGNAQPLVSSINPIQGGVVANAAIVPRGSNGSISVFPNTGMHLYGDINGYFTSEYNPAIGFEAESSTGTAAIRGTNSSTEANAIAIIGVMSSTAPGGASAAVRGWNSGTGAQGVGVWGSQAGSGWGVFGEAPTGYGVIGRVATDAADKAGSSGKPDSSVPTDPTLRQACAAKGESACSGSAGTFWAEVKQSRDLWWTDSAPRSGTVLLEPVSERTRAAVAHPGRSSRVATSARPAPSTSSTRTRAIQIS